MSSKNTAIPVKLLDGSLPAGAREIEARFNSLGIPWQTLTHPAMRTVEDARQHREGLTGGFSKNLFLRNKKGRMWVVTLLEDRDVDLRWLGETIGAGRVSFASEQRLMHYLGIIPGAVSPLAVINDTGNAVQAWIDQGLLDKHPLHFHPCDNTRTTTLSSADLLRYMAACDHTPQILRFPSADGQA